MAKLQRIVPRLSAIATNRLPVLEAKAGSTPRIHGRAWMEIRRKTLLSGGYACVDCGRVHASNQIDHDVPLERGGAADDPSNLRIRCIDCHKAKTRREAKERAGKL